MTVDTIAILVHYIRCIFEIQILSRLQHLQELSYRKEILRQLRTQYTRHSIGMHITEWPWNLG